MSCSTASTRPRVGGGARRRRSPHLRVAAGLLAPSRSAWRPGVSRRPSPTWRGASTFGRAVGGFQALSTGSPDLYAEVESARAAARYAARLSRPTTRTSRWPSRWPRPTAPTWPCTRRRKPSRCTVDHRHGPGTPGAPRPQAAKADQLLLGTPSSTAPTWPVSSTSHPPEPGLSSPRTISASSSSSLSRGSVRLRTGVELLDLLHPVDHRCCGGSTAPRPHAWATRRGASSAASVSSQRAGLWLRLAQDGPQVSSSSSGATCGLPARSTSGQPLRHRDHTLLAALQCLRRPGGELEGQGEAGDPVARRRHTHPARCVRREQRHQPRLVRQRARQQPEYAPARTCPRAWMRDGRRSSAGQRVVQRAVVGRHDARDRVVAPMSSGAGRPSGTPDRPPGPQQPVEHAVLPLQVLARGAGRSASGRSRSARRCTSRFDQTVLAAVSSTGRRSLGILPDAVTRASHRIRAPSV